MWKSITIDPGHNAKPGDTGARGIRFEDECIREVVNCLVPLIDKEYDVYQTSVSSAINVRESIHARCYQANMQNTDLFLSIHFNAFNGKAHGTEIFVFNPGANEKLDTTASNIINNIAALGYRNRGLKKGNWGVLRLTKAPAMLLECCFIDSPRDMNLYDPEKMAQAIALGLLE